MYRCWFVLLLSGCNTYNLSDTATLVVNDGGEVNTVVTTTTENTGVKGKDTDIKGAESDIQGAKSIIKGAESDIQGATTEVKK